MRANQLALASVILTCVGCQHTQGERSPASTASTVSLKQLKDMISAPAADDLAALDGRSVTVRARVALKHRGQQYLWLDAASKTDGPSEHCLQLIIPEQVFQSMPHSDSTLTLTGRLLVMRPSEGLYTNYVIEGVSVHPYCTLAPDVYLRVESVDRRS